MCVCVCVCVFDKYDVEVDVLGNDIFAALAALTANILNLAARLAHYVVCVCNGLLQAQRAVNEVTPNERK